MENETCVPVFQGNTEYIHIGGTTCRLDYSFKIKTSRFGVDNYFFKKRKN